MKNFDLQFVPPEDQDWRDFIERQPNINIFYHPNWMGMLEACYGFQSFGMILRDESGIIRAGLPIMKVDHAFRKRRLISLPFSDHCAPLTADTAALSYLTDTLKSYAGLSASPALEIRWNLLSENLTTDLVLHTLPLDANFEAVRRGIHHSHLRNVRIAQANGIQIRRGVGYEELSVFYDLHLQTRRRQGVPIQPRKYFNLLDELILKKGLGFISLAYHDSVCLAGAVFLYWKNTLTYKYGASTEAGLSLRPNHLIFWDAIQWGCENGYSLLDFGRTNCENNGLRLFKSRWGAHEFPLHYSFFPSKKTSPAQAGLLAPIVNTLIRKSPAWMCKLGGEIYYKRFA